MDEMPYTRIASVAEARKYLGKRIWYLRSEDIDKSGRGYYWPRFMRVDEVSRGMFKDVEGGREVRFKDILRLKVVETAPEATP